jgi:hypothetical protein
MDPPPRSLAREAYDCFMVGTLYGFNRIQAWSARDSSWTNGRLPSDHRVANHPITGQPAAVLALVKDKPLKNGATKNDKSSVMHP